MRKVKIILLIACLFLAIAPLDASPKAKVAICPVPPPSGKDGQRTDREDVIEKWAQLSVGLEEAFMSENSYAIIKSKKVGQKIKKLNLNILNFEDVENICKLGKSLSADYVVYTDVTATKVPDYHLYSAYNNDKVVGWQFTVVMVNVTTQEYEWIGSDVSPLEMSSVLHNIVYQQLHPGEAPKKNIGVPRFGKPVAVKDGLVGMWDFDLGEFLDMTDNNRVIKTNNTTLSTSTMSGYGYTAARKLSSDEHNQLFFNDRLLLNQANWTVCMWVWLPEMQGNWIKYNIKIISEQDEKYDRDAQQMYNYKGYEVTMTCNENSGSDSEYGFRIESDVITTVNGTVATGQEVKGCKQFFPLNRNLFATGWHHVAVTKELDGDDIICIYLDGKLVVRHNTEHVRKFAGQAILGWHAEFLDNLRIYDRTISGNEVKEIIQDEKNQTVD